MADRWILQIPLLYNTYLTTLHVFHLQMTKSPFWVRNLQPKKKKEWQKVSKFLSEINESVADYICLKEIKSQETKQKKLQILLCNQQDKL